MAEPGAPGPEPVHAHLGARFRPPRNERAAPAKLALVYQTERRVELWSREGSEGWPEDNPIIFTQISDVLPLPTVGAMLALADIYDGVELT